MKNHLKIAITGAAGQIGYALLFRLASGEAFGADTTLDLHLIELPEALPALHGIAMELEDCAFPLLKNIICTDDLKTGFKDCDVALLVGAIPRKAGMERADLLEKNGAVFKTQGQILNEVANRNVRVLVVGNPCNTNGLIAQQNAPDLLAENFYAMTTLDETRAIAALAKKANVSANDVQNLIIWGNHSPTQFPDFYHAAIKQKPATEVISDLSWLQNTFIPGVQKRGAEVIRARGSSSAASAANAIIRTMRYLFLQNPPEVFSLAIKSKGEYGVNEGLFFSFPCVREQNKIKIKTGIIHNDFAKAKIAETLAELRKEYEHIKQTKLI